MTTNTLPIIKRMNGDGSKWGLSDWYDDLEKALARAMKRKTPWTTDWYASKKEVASARITFDGKRLVAEASVSDDFDTEGYGSATATHRTLDALRDAVDRAYADAESNRAENQNYRGYSLVHHKGERATCIDYYIVNAGTHDLPTGDCYYHWGWQESDDEGKTLCCTPRPSKAVARKLADHALEFGGGLRIGAWEIKPWGDQP